MLPRPYGQTEQGILYHPPSLRQGSLQCYPQPDASSVAPWVRKSNYFFMLLSFKSESSMKASDQQNQSPFLLPSYQRGWEDLASALGQMCDVGAYSNQKMLDFPPRLDFPCYPSFQSQLPPVNSGSCNQGPYPHSVDLYSQWPFHFGRMAHGYPCLNLVLSPLIPNLYLQNTFRYFYFLCLYLFLLINSRPRQSLLSYVLKLCLTQFHLFCSLEHELGLSTPTPFPLPPPPKKKKL